jgi:hypothetical protein
MKYKVTHRDGVEIIEADSYEAEGLCTARKVTFMKESKVIKNVLLVDLITRINEESEEQ